MRQYMRIGFLRGKTMNKGFISFIAGIVLCGFIAAGNADSGAISAKKKKQNQTVVQDKITGQVKKSSNTPMMDRIEQFYPGSSRIIPGMGKKTNTTNESATSAPTEAPAATVAAQPSLTEPAPAADAPKPEVAVVPAPAEARPEPTTAAEGADFSDSLSAQQERQPTPSRTISMTPEEQKRATAGEIKPPTPPKDDTTYEVDDDGNVVTKKGGTVVQTPSYKESKIQQLQTDLKTKIDTRTTSLGTRPVNDTDVDAFLSKHKDVVIPARVVGTQDLGNGLEAQTEITDPAEIKRRVAQSVYDREKESIEKDQASGEQDIQKLQNQFTAQDEKAEENKGAADGLDRSGVVRGLGLWNGGTYDAGVVKVHPEFLQKKEKAIASNVTGNLAQIGQGLAASIKDPETAAKATSYATYAAAAGGLTNAWQYAGTDSLASKHFAASYETEALRDANIGKRNEAIAKMQEIKTECEAANNCSQRVGEMNALSADAQALATQIATQNSQSWSDWWAGMGNRTTGVVSLAGAGAMGYVAHENEVMARELANHTEYCKTHREDPACGGTPDPCKGKNPPAYCTAATDPCTSLNPPAYCTVIPQPPPPSVFGPENCLPGMTWTGSECIDGSGGPGSGGGPGGGPLVNSGGGGGGGFRTGTLSLDDLRAPGFATGAGSAGGAEAPGSAQNESVMAANSATDQRFPSSGGGGSWGGSGKSGSDTESGSGSSSSGGNGGTTASGGAFNIGDIGGNYGSVGGDFDLSKFMPNWMPGDGDASGSGLAVRQLASQKEEEQKGQILGSNSPSLFSRITKAHMKKAHELKEEVF